MGPSEQNKGSGPIQKWFHPLDPTFQISTHRLLPQHFEGLCEWLGGILILPTWLVLGKGVLISPYSCQGDMYLALQIRILDILSHKNTAIYG